MQNFLLILSLSIWFFKVATYMFFSKSYPFIVMKVKTILRSNENKHSFSFAKFLSALLKKINYFNGFFLEIGSEPQIGCC